MGSTKVSSFWVAFQHCTYSKPHGFPHTTLSVVNSTKHTKRKYAIFFGLGIFITCHTTKWIFACATNFDLKEKKVSNKSQVGLSNHIKRMYFDNIYKSITSFCLGSISTRVKMSPYITDLNSVTPNGNLDSFSSAYLFHVIGVVNLLGCTGTSATTSFPVELADTLW